MQIYKFDKFDKFDRVVALLLAVMGAMLCNAAYSLIKLKILGFSDADGFFIFKVIVIAAFSVLWLIMVCEYAKYLVKLKNESKPTAIPTNLAMFKKSGNGSFSKYTQRKYFIALCLMYPNLGGTLQEIQAVGLGQQPELSPNCKGYIQGFMQALIDARAWHFDSLVQMDAFVQQLLTDTDILKSFVKDFKNDIEETIELTLNPSADHL